MSVAGQGSTGYGVACHGKAGKATQARLDQAPPGKPRLGLARQARRGAAGRGEPRHGEARQAWHGEAGPGKAGNGKAGGARPGLARRGSARQAWLVSAWTGEAWQGIQFFGERAANDSTTHTRAMRPRKDSPMSKKQEVKQSLVIPPPNLRILHVTVKGVAPYVQNKFSHKAIQQMKEAQQAGSTARSKRKKEPKDFQACYEGSIHHLPDGGYGIPATAFRSAMVSACRTAGFKMTLAKLSVFVLADGYDPVDQTPLVRMTKGDPEYFEAPVSNETGVRDIRARAKWSEGWEAKLSIRYDADQFTEADVLNLLSRVGWQVGIGEGRPDSKKSTGMGWGLFDIIRDSVSLEVGGVS